MKLLEHKHVFLVGCYCFLGVWVLTPCTPLLDLPRIHIYFQGFVSNHNIVVVLSKNNGITVFFLYCFQPLRRNEKKLV